MRCLMCHHRLRSPESISRGLGPVCAGRDAQRPYLFPEAAIQPTRADFILLRGASGLLQVLSGGRP